VATAPAKRPRTGGRPSRRDEILRTATTLFATGGSRGTCLADIARETGLSAAAILHHFGSKDALLMEVVAAIDVGDAAAVPPDEGRPALQRLAALRHWPAVLASDPGRAQLARLATVLAAEGLDPEHPLHGPMAERYRRLRASVRDAVAAAQREGSIRPDVQPALIATEVVGAMLGMQLQWLLDPGNVTLDAAFDEYFTHLLGELTRVDAKPAE
jgi:AcrR family transcriptional regulator